MSLEDGGAGQSEQSCPMTPPSIPPAPDESSTNPRERVSPAQKECFISKSFKKTMTSELIPYTKKKGAGTKRIRHIDAIRTDVLLLTLKMNAGHLSLARAADLFINPSLMAEFDEEGGTNFRRDVMVRDTTRHFSNLNLSGS